MSKKLYRVITGVILLSLNLLSFSAAAGDGVAEDSLTPSLATGIEVFQSRCTLCHGSVGMGEGLLPLSLQDYPATNLLEPKYGTDVASLREIIIWGGTKGDMSPLSPPWGNELTWTQIESVIMFMELLRGDTEEAIALLSTQAQDREPNLKTGRELYRSRCTLCHGTHGEGDGKMARLIKTPPPFDLTKSRMPDEKLLRIIGEGGGEVGRSPQMPPWKGELSETQLESVVLYIKTLRD